MSITLLIGLTIKTITGMENQSEQTEITTECGRVFIMFHEQDCCEQVYLADVIGDTEDLIGSPIILAEEASNSKDTVIGDSETWTFYKLETLKGSVLLRWYGTSNGYYSESVSFYEVR